MSGCREHGPFLYFCTVCHERWRRANPRTSAAIREFAAGRGSSATIVAARKADRHHIPAPEPEPDRRRLSMSELGELANTIETAVALGRVVDDQLVTWGQLLTFIDEAIRRAE